MPDSGMVKEHIVEKNKGLICEALGRRRLSGGSGLRPPGMMGEVA